MISLVVGYQATALRSGFIGSGATFLPITGDTIDLTDISVTGYDPEEGTEEEVYIQSLDFKGKLVPGSIYSWIDINDDGDIIRGWLNEAGDLIESGDASFKAGEAVWVYAPSADFNLQYAGQVATAPISNSLRAGFKLVANPTPVAVDLTEVVVKGYDPEEGTEEEVYIQSLDFKGKLVPGSIYSWIDIDDDGDIIYGWLNEAGDLIEAEDAFLEPSEAVWVYAPNASFTLEFPGVSLK